MLQSKHGAGSRHPLTAGIDQAVGVAGMGVQVLPTGAVWPGAAAMSDAPHPPGPVVTSTGFPAPPTPIPERAWCAPTLSDQQCHPRAQAGSCTDAAVFGRALGASPPPSLG